VRQSRPHCVTSLAVCTDRKLGLRRLGVLQAGAVARQLAEYEALAGNPRVRAMLDTIAFAEGADYDVMFTGKRFDSTKGWQHPRAVQKSPGYASDAAGRYQFLSTTWDRAAKELGLKDFSPRNQDIAALRLMEWRGVDLNTLAAGDPTADTFAKLAPEWASLPTKAGKSAYGQPVKGLDKLMGRYRQSLSATGAPPAAGATFQAPGGQAGAATGGVPVAAGGGVFSHVKQDSPLPMPGQGVELGMDARSLALGGVMAAAAAAGAGPGLQFLAGAAQQSREKQRMAGGELMAQALGIQPQATAPAQAGPVQQQALAGQIPASAGALAGGPAQSGSPLRVGRVADPKEDVFPTTGPHLDVRVQKPDGSYINPKTARSLLAQLHVGGKPLYSQQGSDWVAAHPVTSGFGPRAAPAPGASTYHRGVDYGVGAHTPLEWRGGGQYSFEGGVGRIKLPDGTTVKLLHTRPR
jgi:muramidase (phage lysozyme)